MGIESSRLQVPEVKSADFRSQVLELMSSLELQAQDIRYRFRLARTARMMVVLPHNESLLLAFMAVADLLRIRDIDVSWEKWYEELL